LRMRHGRVSRLVFSGLSKVNVFRKEGFPSVTNGIRSLAHDIHRLFSFLQ
jgi:hypothetical protein